MKKPIALILTAALMALPVSPVMVLADTTEKAAIVSATEVDPGTLPDSPLYWLDELVEKLQVALTFDSQKKIKLLEKHANERMAEFLALAEKVNSEEAKLVATETKELEELEKQKKSVESTTKQEESKESTSEDNQVVVTVDLSKTTTGSAITNPKLEKKLKGCEKALTRYNEKIAQAQELLEQLENPDSEEYKNLQAALIKVNANNAIVLGTLLEKLPPQASQRLALNIVRSMEKAVDKMEKMESKNQKPEESTTAQLEANQEEKSKVTVDKVAKPVEVKKVTPVVTVGDTPKQENTEVSDELTQKEYKALKKEAREALKQFQEELGLKGPEKEHDSDKEKSKDYDRDHEREELNKETAKSYSNKNDSRYYQKDHNDRNDRDRDDDQGNDKGSQDSD
ncbi:MAG: DUF5667 domain-containing protein [Desulfitobacterium sp.]